MTASKTIGVLFIEGYADWEYGMLAASAVEWFGARAIAISPHASPLTSIAGFRLDAARGANPAENKDLDAVAVIGSDGWAAKDAPDVSPLLKAVAARGGVIGGICAGTLALARAGLFEDVGHTSNGRDWILGHEPAYAGAANYRDVAHAVADNNIVSAPGSAPGTFAAAFLETLYPEQAGQIGEMRAMFAREHAMVAREHGDGS
ncbi:DJ-1/PfpI family protein [Aminobacter niigataensis]|uniref:DJ-1/PfpI family protein n=1 Tax=Aminobacter niigataensis TaxID=83265 RepID=UPI0024CA93AC|nr:DJ-1/PfpI family protein [Aminobacter niigataensis]CAI2932770.1 Putative protease YdeA [Aminobacter niigataensis]